MGTQRVSLRYGVLIGLGLLLWTSPLSAQRKYWKVTVDELASGMVKYPHVEITGRLRLVRKESDLDKHLKLTGLKSFIVAECIPKIPCEGKLIIGSMVTVRGIPRYDAEHKWWEVNPVEELIVYTN